MGKWRWINLLIVGYACYLSFNYEAVPDRWVNLQELLIVSVKDQLRVGFDRICKAVIIILQVGISVDFIEIGESRFPSNGDFILLLNNVHDSREV